MSYTLVSIIILLLILAVFKSTLRFPFSILQSEAPTEGGIWVVFDKTNEKIGEIIDVNIDDARGVTLFGSRTYQGYNYEVA